MEYVDKSLIRERSNVLVKSDAMVCAAFKNEQATCEQRVERYIRNYVASRERIGELISPSRFVTAIPSHSLSLSITLTRSRIIERRDLQNVYC